MEDVSDGLEKYRVFEIEDLKESQFIYLLFFF